MCWHSSELARGATTSVRKSAGVPPYHRTSGLDLTKAQELSTVSRHSLVKGLISPGHQTRCLNAAAHSAIGFVANVLASSAPAQGVRPAEAMSATARRHRSRGRCAAEFRPVAVACSRSSQNQSVAAW